MEQVWPPLRAVIFDLDGTLYSQRAMRAVMVALLARRFFEAPADAVQCVRSISAYRRAQETLRARSSNDRGDLAAEQISIAAGKTGVPANEVSRHVSRWIEQEPLRWIRRARRRGLMQLIFSLRQRDIRIGVVSDYPAREKLEALGILEFVDAVVCAQDSRVQRFKPDPAGLQLAMNLLGVSARNSMYVGDRLAVDGEAARKAGMRFVVLSRRRLASTPESLCVKDFVELQAAIDAN